MDADHAPILVSSLKGSRFPVFNAPIVTMASTLSNSAIPLPLKAKLMSSLSVSQDVKTSAISMSPILARDNVNVS